MKKILLYFTIVSNIFATPGALPTQNNSSPISRGDVYAQCKAESKNVVEYRKCKEKKLGDLKVLEQMKQKMKKTGNSDSVALDTPFTRQRDVLVLKLDNSIQRTTFLRNCISAATNEKEINDCRKIQSSDFGKIDTQNYGKEKVIEEEATVREQPQSQKLPEQKNQYQKQLPLPPINLGI